MINHDTATEGRTMANKNEFPEPVLSDDELYLCDNGACYCGKHCGASARFTGRDISGQRVERVTPADAQYFRDELGAELVCESCGKAAALSYAELASRLMKRSEKFAAADAAAERRMGKALRALSAR
jgi:hypothetical protein